LVNQIIKVPKGTVVDIANIDVHLEHSLYVTVTDERAGYFMGKEYINHSCEGENGSDD